jgi:hypothetical protein
MTEAAEGMRSVGVMDEEAYKLTMRDLPYMGWARDWPGKRNNLSYSAIESGARLCYIVAQGDCHDQHCRSRSH